MKRFIRPCLVVICILAVLGIAYTEDTYLVSLSDLEPSIMVDLKYATDENFMEEVLYTDDRCFVRPEIAVQLIHAHRYLETQGYGIKVFDCYRPLSVQKKMFERFPQPGYVADPKRGSNHNRAAAVDVGLVDDRGRELVMPSDYDEFTERAHHDYTGASPEAIENRERLKEAMMRFGFLPISTEWWHFNATNAQAYEVLDILLKDLP